MREDRQERGREGRERGPELRIANTGITELLKGKEVTCDYIMRQGYVQEKQVLVIRQRGVNLDSALFFMIILKMTSLSCSLIVCKNGNNIQKPTYISRLL